MLSERSDDKLRMEFIAVQSVINWLKELDGEAAGDKEKDILKYRAYMKAVEEELKARGYYIHKQKHYEL